MNIGKYGDIAMNIYPIIKYPLYSWCHILYIFLVFMIFTWSNIYRIYNTTLPNNIILCIFTSYVSPKCVINSLFRWTFGDASIMPQMLKPLESPFSVGKNLFFWVEFCSRDLFFFFLEKSWSGQVNDWTGYFPGYFWFKGFFVALFRFFLGVCCGLFMRNLYSINYDGIVDARNLLHSELETMAHSQFDDLPQF